MLPLEAIKTSTRHAGSFWDFYFFKIIHTNGYSHKHDFNQNIASLPHQQDGTTQAKVCQPLPPPRTDTNGPEHTGHCKHSSEPLAMPSSFGTKGFMPKLGKTAFVVFLNYSKNKTSR